MLIRELMLFVRAPTGKAPTFKTRGLTMAYPRSFQEETQWNCSRSTVHASHPQGRPARGFPLFPPEILDAYSECWTNTDPQPGVWWWQLHDPQQWSVRIRKILDLETARHPASIARHVSLFAHQQKVRGTNWRPLAWWFGLSPSLLCDYRRETSRNEPG